MDAKHFRVKSKKLLEPLKRLPEEIILEIFGKLQIRDLLVFRCVSKPWCIQLDNSPEFLNLTRNSFSLMLVDDKRVCSLDNNTLSTSTLSDGIEGIFKKILCPLVPLEWDLKDINFVGSCNGLVCMYREDKEGFCLWNPCTNEIRLSQRARFPVFDPDKYNTSCVIFMGQGFGYDSNNDDYKYVFIFRYNSPQTDGQSEVHTYSFKRNTWKQVDVPYVIATWGTWGGEREPNGVFCSGTLHWFASKKSSYHFKILLAFDMTGGVKEIPQPEKKFGANKYVDVLDDCLCILYSTSTGFQVCVMKDYGMRESWTLMYDISELTVLEVKSFVYLARIECLKTGEIVLELHCDDTAALVLYDPKNEKATILKVYKNLRRDSKLRSLFFRYVKSLVKLNSES